MTKPATSTGPRKSALVVKGAFLRSMPFWERVAASLRVKYVLGQFVEFQVSAFIFLFESHAPSLSCFYGGERTKPGHLKEP